MKLINFIVLSLMSFSLVHCAHVNSVSLTSIPAVKGPEVKTTTSKIIFLGFNFNNDYVDNMAEELQRQCPNGKITGILTKDESINYFLFFVWERRVTAKGYCQSSNSKVSLLQ
jgi:hypothetical protein